MLDMASDVATIVLYLNTEGQEGNAHSLLAMVCLCLFFQLMLVYVQTINGPRYILMMETLIVLSGTKPGFDAARVSSGQEKLEHNVFDPSLELTCTRAFEMVFEAIPGGILQCVAAMQVLQDGGEVSNVAVASVIISALTTGYSSACIR